MTEIVDASLKQFLDDLASRQATPGGGSVAALLGAQSAALVSMVCNLTIGKPKYSAVEQDMQILLKQAEGLRSEFTEMVQADVQVFNQLMACYSLPKNTEQEIQARNDQIQHCLVEATKVPLNCAKASVKAIKLCAEAAEKGSKLVISDAGVAVMTAYAALKSALLNIDINLPSIKDEVFSAEVTSELEKINKEVESVQEIYELVQSRL